MDNYYRMDLDMDTGGYVHTLPNGRHCSQSARWSPVGLSNAADKLNQIIEHKHAATAFKQNFLLCIVRLIS
jgi:hypothetical protein